MSIRPNYRDRRSTGRLLYTVIRPRGIFARISSSGPDPACALQKLAHDIGASAESLERAVLPAERPAPKPQHPLVHFDGRRQNSPLSVRSAFRDKHILLIGVTGFIGKVWLANTLTDLPEVGRIYLLIQIGRASCR